MHDDFEEGTTWWTNHYRCPCCRHEWQDGWDAQVDDDCPASGCGLRHISPYFSDDGSGTEEQRLAALAQADAALEQELAADAAARARPAA